MYCNFRSITIVFLLVLSIQPAMARSPVYKSQSQKAFNPKNAPRPDLCFLKFVQTAKQARSMKEILPYLPSNKVVKLEKLADRANDKSTYYEKSRSYYHKLASNVIKVLGYKVMPRDTRNGTVIAQIKVQVRNDSKRTKKYKFRRDTIKMIGEGNYWKFKSRRKSSVVYNGSPPVKKLIYN